MIYTYTDQVDLRISSASKKLAEQQLAAFYERMNEAAYECGFTFEHGNPIKCRETEVEPGKRTDVEKS